MVKIKPRPSPALAPCGQGAKTNDKGEGGALLFEATSDGGLKVSEQDVCLGRGLEDYCSCTRCCSTQTSANNSDEDYSSHDSLRSDCEVDSALSPTFADTLTELKRVAVSVFRLCQIFIKKLWLPHLVCELSFCCTKTVPISARVRMSTFVLLEPLSLPHTAHLVRVCKRRSRWLHFCIIYKYFLFFFILHIHMLLFI